MTRSASPMSPPTTSAVPAPGRSPGWPRVTTEPNSTSSACRSAAASRATSAPRSRGRSTSFHDVTARTDAAAARLLRELEVDIAVDLDGYVEDGRPGIFAARPAPIQVNFGYPATMGAEFIDYIIADRTVLPFDQQKLVTEKIVHLPDCHQANDKMPELAPELPSREAVGLPAIGFVFCCFAESFKIARPVFDVWMRLLSRNAGSVLWLSRGSDDACERLRSEAAAPRHRSGPARFRGAGAAGRASLAPSARGRVSRYAAVQRGDRKRCIVGGRAGRDLQGQYDRGPHRRQPEHGSRPLRSDRRRPRRLRSPGIATRRRAGMAGRPQAAPRRGACRGAACSTSTGSAATWKRPMPTCTRCWAAAPRRKALP